MVLLDIFPTGTVFMNQRKGDVFKGAVQIQTIAGGAREAKIISDADETIHWPGGVFGSPSGFLHKAGKHLTTKNPEPVKARSGWAQLHVGSLRGPTLGAVRTAWQKNGVEAAKRLVADAMA
jgi:hypothetical protein